MSNNRPKIELELGQEVRLKLVKDKPYTGESSVGVYHLYSVFVNRQMKIFLDALAANKSGGDFLLGDWQTFGDFGQRCTVHQVRHIISGIEENAPEAADGFLRAALVAGDRNAINRCQDAVEMADNFAHGNFVRVSGEDISATNSGHAVHPALRL